MTIFNKGTGVGSGSQSSPNSVAELGYWDTDLPDHYAVTIIDKRPEAYARAAKVPVTIKIRAPLVEKFSTRTESTWAPLGAGSFTDNLLGAAIQVFSSRALVSQYSSRRIWTGTSPLDFTINMKFHAINDAYEDVFRPVLELQRMSLPFSGVTSDASKTKSFFAKSFLAPPGPNPFDLGTDVGSFLGKKDIYEDITVRIGRLMTINKVVVKSVIIQHEPKFDRLGRSVEAVATINFQTFELVTKESLDDIYMTASQNVDTVKDSRLDKGPGRIPGTPDYGTRGASEALV